LGLLKDVPFNIANFNYGTSTSVVRTVSYASGGFAFAVSGAPLGLEVGQQFTLSGLTTPPNGTYTVAAITYFSSSFQIETVEYSGGSFSSGSATITYILPTYKLTNKLRFSEIFAICLNATGLELDCRVFSDLDVNGGVTGRWLEDVYLSGETFLNSDEWTNCYNVMETILKRFRACLFQSKGVWNIIRWDELREDANVIPFQTYDNDFTYLSTTTSHDQVYNYDAGEIVSGLELGILRPYKFVRQTFNFVQPENLLKNYNFEILGNLVRTYTDGANTVSEYQLANWDDGIAAAFPERLIRITVDADGNEISRYAVITGATGDSSRSATSTPIEVNAKDKFRWSFSYRTDISQPGNLNNVFSVRLFDGTTTRYLGDNGEWKIPFGFTYTVFAGDNTNEWHTVEIESQEIPYNGLLYIYLAEATPSGSDETWYKDLSFEYIPSVNETTKIKGQVHTNTQSVKTKNADDSEIFIDDSPRNSIRGTMFLGTSTSLVRDRTLKWLPNNFRIGQVTTFQELFWRRRQRIKLQGSFIGVVQTARAFNKLSIINSLLYPDSNLITGQLSIDYKNDLVNSSCVEMYEDGEVDADLGSVYQFKYLYEKI
jgi:hypothetical protein